MTRRPPELSGQELAQMMRAVDERLAEQLPAPGAPPVAGVLPPLPALEVLDARVRRLRQMRAPLFAVSGWRPSELLRRALNLPIAAFGYKQRRFNEELVDALELALDVIADLRLHLERQEQEIRALRSEAENATHNAQNAEQ